LSRRKRVGGDDAVRPEFTAPYWGVDDLGHTGFDLHQSTDRLATRQPWLPNTQPHGLAAAAGQHAVRLCDPQRFLPTCCWSALNVDDGPLSLSLTELGVGAGEIVSVVGRAARSCRQRSRDRAARLADHRRASSRRWPASFLPVGEIVEHGENRVHCPFAPRGTVSSTKRTFEV